MDEFGNISFNLTTTEDTSEGTQLGGVDAFSLTWQSLYFIITVVSNLLVLYIFIFKLKERTYSNTCLISLAFCDLVVGLVALPADIYYYNVGCNFIWYLGIAISMSEFALSSIGFFILMQLTLHRIFLLTKPTKTTEKLTRLRITFLVGIWIVEYLGWFCVFLIAVLTDTYDSSTLIFKFSPMSILLVNLVSYIGPVLIDVTLITILIVTLIFRRKNLVHVKQTKAQSTLQTGKIKYSKDVRAVVFLLILIVVIVLTQSFFIIIWPLGSFGYEIDPYLSEFADWISYANSLFNPIVLFIFHEPLKRKLFEMLEQTVSQICIWFE